MSPRLSLCLISNDGEENLIQCLDSVRGHVDEIVIADTGMDDTARAACVRYGANVYQFDHRNHPEAFFHDTAEECAKFAAPAPFSGQWALGDFAAARNESFNRATGDYIAWIDSDDVLMNGELLRTIVNDMAGRNAGMAFLPYNYAQDHLGRVFYRQWRERIIKKGVAHWLNPVHEVLMPIAPVGETPRYENPIYSHKRKANRKGIDNRNYKILLHQAWKLKTANPSAALDPRILFYLGQEARFVDPIRAIGFYEEYLCSSGWPEERAAAHCAVGQLLEMGVIAMPPDAARAQAEREYATAAAEMPENPDGLHGLARVAYMRERWHDAVRYAEAAFKVGNTDTMLGTNPVDRTYRPHVYFNYALAKVGRVEDAIKSCKAALEAMPDDPGVPGGASGMVTLNLKIYEQEIAQRAEKAKAAMQQQPDRKVAEFNLSEDLETPPHPAVKTDALVIWGTQIWKQIVASGDGKRARAFLESLPASITAHPVVERMFESTSRRFGIAGDPKALLAARSTGCAFPSQLFGAPAALDVVFYLGPGPEPWDPSTPETKGLGGSETAAIEMAKNLAKLGHRCAVFAEATGTFDGVQYIHHSNFRGCSADIFVASRAPWAVDHFGPVTSKLKLLWVHDVHCGPPGPEMERRLLAFDRVLCLSQWHKDFFLSCYPTLHPDKIIVTRNGIDPARFRGYPLNNPLPGLATHALPNKTNSLVFSSSPNRGLDMLVHNFQTVIKPAVQDAELHVFYGFDTWETFARQRGATDELAAIEGFKSLLPPLGSEAGGIYNHGKRPQSEVAAAYLRAKVWPYLSGFTETSCITAMEAMAAGAVPVYSALAALPETVGKYGIALRNEDPEVGKVFCAEVIDLLRDDSRRGPMATAARAYALSNLSWSALAKDWSDMFSRLIAEVSASPISAWSA